MFKGHPKGLFVAFFANMGERFGFYTMISIFVLFMQAKYGMSAAAAGSLYPTFLVGLGTGLFKGNLQALVGNLYDDPKYAGMRDRAFNIFYMGINIGAMFAPSASMAVCNWIMGKSGLLYDARIPALANDFLKGKLADASSFLTIAQGQDASVTLDTLGRFATDYVNTLSKSYHFGFGVPCIS